MEKSQSDIESLPPPSSEKQTQKPEEEKTAIQNQNPNKNKKQRPLWDCESTLYDSFELNSFQNQLDSAILSSSRTFSMPRHLPSHLPPPPPDKKPPSLSRSFRKLLKSFFRPSNSKLNNHTAGPDIGPLFLDHQAQSEKCKDKGKGKYYVVYEKVNGLSTIPELPEVASSSSPEIGSLVRRTTSDRFIRSNSVSVFCR